MPSVVALELRLIEGVDNGPLEEAIAMAAADWKRLLPFQISELPDLFVRTLVGPHPPEDDLIELAAFVFIHRELLEPTQKLFQLRSVVVAGNARRFFNRQIEKFFSCPFERKMTYTYNYYRQLVTNMNGLTMTEQDDKDFGNKENVDPRHNVMR